MKRIAYIFTVYAALFFCANSFASVSIGADESKIAVEVYVSSSAGDDSNDGSKSKPFKTFSKIPRKNARIFLKRGDVFYEPLSGLENCVVDSYPNNGKRLPVICGLRFIKNPSAWENMGGGIWRLDMNADANFSGRNPPAATRGNLFNNIGGIYDASSDTLHGRVLKKHSDLKDNWDMISSPEFRKDKVTDQTFRYLYLKLDENPAKYADSLALITYGNGVSNIRNCTVRNIAIKGFGRHGLTGCIGGKIENTPYEPKREGYTFGGWYADKDFNVKLEDYLAQNVISANVTAYAKWEPTKYTLSVGVNNPNAGKFVVGEDATEYSEYETQFVAGESFELTKVDLKSEAYAFIGWYVYDGEKWSRIDSADTYAFTAAAQSVSLQARWQGERREAVFYRNYSASDTEITETKSFYYGDSFTDSCLKRACSHCGGGLLYGFGKVSR